MIRWVIRKFIYIVGLVTVIMFLKNNSGEIGSTINAWICGEKDNSVAQAVCEFVDSISEGNGLSDAVEVFYENLQG